jgi:hypothetical protein
MKATAIMNEDLAKFGYQTVGKLSLFKILLLFNYLYITEASHRTFKVRFMVSKG